VLRYSELHCLTNFSFLRAASHPHELVQRAAELGYSALAITDRHSLAGVVRAHEAAREVNKDAPRIKLLIGAELRPSDAPPVVLLATDRAAYARLTRLLTLGKSRAPKGECAVTFADLADFGTGLLACVFSDDVTTSTAAPMPRDLARYRDAFGDRTYLLAEAHHGPDDATWFAALAAVSKKSRVPLVAAGGVYYHGPERRPLQDVLTAIRLGRTVAECGAAQGNGLFANAERHLHDLEELELRYELLPGALRRTNEVAARCTFSLDELRYQYPKELSPANMTPLEYLVERTRLGAADRYPQGVPEKVERLIRHELEIIEALQYEAYFLTVWDLVRFARERGILCQGRGSAANSAVCYCLGVTSVDPSKTEVLFERFISKERGEAPDIDVDFEHERREEVLQYLYDKYGRERAAMTAEVIRYRSRSAAREVGKALGLTPERITAISKTLVDHHRNPETKWDECARDGGLDLRDRTVQQYLTLVEELAGFPRHLSQHVGGMVMTEGPLCELVPIENAAMPGRTVVEWNKDDLDALGILKVDCLALGMLTAIRKCFDLIRKHTGRELTLANVPQDDPTVYDMISAADTIGVFQIESRAQMSMLPRLQPRCYYDLVIEVAIVRPGPIQGQMVHPYLKRRAGLEPVEYPSDAVREVLKQTLGVPLFQEQVMKLAIVAAGFTAGEADQLRRAMAAWRRDGDLEPFRKKLLDGMRAHGLDDEFAERVYQQIRGFASYGFPESHAASFALLVYVSAWLKKHYPAAFCAALLNSQPMGFYAPAQLVRDARQHGVEIRPVDVNHSERDTTLEPTTGGEYPHAVRLGLRLLQGLSRAAAEKIVVARRNGEFRSTHDFAARTKLNQATLALLARGDALSSLERDRRAALWQTLPLKKGPSQPLFAGLAAAVEEPLAPAVTPLLQPTPFEEVIADYRSVGLSLRGHPIGFLREEFDRRECMKAAALGYLNDGLMVRVGGLVLLRQRPSTSRGITFVTLEDETGVINLVVFANVWQKFRDVARAAKVWLVDGTLQVEGRVVHVVASRLVDGTSCIGAIRAPSRDFH